MEFEQCDGSPTGEVCNRPKGSKCLLPDHGVCDNFVITEATRIGVEAKIFCSRWNKKRPDKPQIIANENAIYLAMKSTLDDIYRYKSYHLEHPHKKVADSVKFSAYICKWIPRIKPIEYADRLTTVQQNDIVGLTINQVFALEMARAHISHEIGRDYHYKPHYLLEFLYDLLYRELNSDGLLHIFQNIFSAVKIGQAGILDILSERKVAGK